MENRTFLWGKCFSILLVVSMLISTPLSALATTIDTVGGEDVQSTFTEELSEDKSHVNVEMELTTKENIKLQEVILPDGTTLYPQARDYLDGFRVSKDGIEKNVVKYKAFKNEMLTFEVKYIASNKEEKTVSFSYEVSKLEKAEDTKKDGHAVYTVTFEMNGGDPLPEKLVQEGSSIMGPDWDIPYRKGYVWDGFYKDEGLTQLWEFDNDVMPDHDITLYAKWKSYDYTVIYDTGGGSTYPNKKVEFDEQNLLPDVPPVKPGYIFRFWHYGFYTEDLHYNMASSDTKYRHIVDEEEWTHEGVLRARWSKKTYGVYYHETEDAPWYTHLNVKNWDDTGLVSLPDPIRPGYKFLGWKCGDTAVTNSTKFSDIAIDTGGDSVVTHLVAQWEKLYEVVYDTGEGWKCGDTAVTNSTKFSDIAIDTGGDSVVTHLVAQWEKLYEVVYDTGEGTPVPTNSQVTWDETVLPADEPTRIGYVFNGWVFEDAVNGNKSVSENTKYSELAADDTVTSITLVAQWTAKTYTVKYDTAGGTTINDKTDATWEGTILPGIEPTKAGYIFAGWKHGNTDVDANTKYSELAADDTVASITLIAQWQKLYEVVYDTGEGTPIPTNSQVTWEGIVWPIDVTLRTGYELTGWLYIDKLYEVVYDTGEGTPIPTNSQVTWEGIVWPIDVTLRTGYELTGWLYIDPVNGDKVVNQNTKYSELAADDTVTSITLVAQWTAKTYTVKYDTAGGTVKYDTAGGTAINDKTDATWEGTVLPGTEPTKAGFAFAGWTHVGNAVDDTKLYKDLATTDADGTFITLVATWREVVDYEVTFDANGGSAVAGNSLLVTGLKYNDVIPMPNVERTGFSFNGWIYKGQPVATGARIVDIEADSTIKQLELVAQWTAKTYTVKYDTAGGTAINDKTDATWEGTVLPGTEPTKAGFAFAGWTHVGNAVDPVNGDKVVNQNTKYSELAADDTVTSITLVAQWTAKTYTVKYDTAGGTTIHDKTDATWEGTVLPGIEPTKAGFAFAGWTHDGNAVDDTTLYKDLATTDADGTFITLVATWRELSDYEITFQLNGGTVVTRSSVVVSNMKYNDVIPMPKVENQGYTFLNWTYKGNVVLEGSSIKDIEADSDVKQLVLEANWKQNIHTVEFAYVNGAPDDVDVPSSVEVEHGKLVSEPVVQEVEGWKQDGWYMDETCQTAYDFNTAVTGNMKLYMKWIKVDPVTPQEPTQPEDTGNIDSGQGNNSTVTTPSTGDSTNTNVLFLAFIVSGFGLFLYRRKEAK